MPAPKGHPNWNKTTNSGRPLGSKNRKTEEWERFTDWFLTVGIERLPEEMAKLEGKDYILTIKDLLEFFKPKHARVEHTGENGEELKILINLNGKNN